MLLTTNLFETQKGHKGQWSVPFCETIGIAKEKLPPLMNSSEVVGGLINEDIISLGFQKFPVGNRRSRYTLCYFGSKKKLTERCESVRNKPMFLTICEIKQSLIKVLSTVATW